MDEGSAVSNVARRTAFTDPGWVRGCAVAGLLAAAAAPPVIAQSDARPAAGGCGYVVTIETCCGMTTRYALAHPPGAPAPGEPVALVLLVVGHAADSCVRSPASLLSDITARTSSDREQVVVVTGGPMAAVDVPSSVEACGGRSPHGYIGQEAVVVEGIARFIRGGSH